MVVYIYKLIMSFMNFSFLVWFSRCSNIFIGIFSSSSFGNEIYFKASISVFNSLLSRLSKSNCFKNGLLVIIW